MRQLCILIIFWSIISCSSSQEAPNEPSKATQVQLTTSMGTIIVGLSDKTPLHRDNFIKLVNDGMYDSIIFHRVIQNFVIQAGEFDSIRLTNLDSAVITSLDYRVPAEFDSTLFHKRGALGAARDGNPNRASSSIQFYIVQRGSRPDSLIAKDEERINASLRQHEALHSPENKMWLDSVNHIYETNNFEAYGALYDTIAQLTENFEDYQEYTIPEEHKEIYRTLGGTPHLDQNYTIFGEVIAGMNVVDSIAAVPVGDGGRPIDQIIILNARVIED